MIKKLPLHTSIALLALLLTAGGFLAAQEDKAQGKPAPVGVENTSAKSDEDESQVAGEIDKLLDFVASENNSAPDYKIYVFLAYGLTCLLLFLFFIWNIIQGRKLGKRIDYLEERFSQGPGDQAAR